MRVSSFWLATALVTSATICTAQTLPGIGGKPGGLPSLPGGLLGGGLPNIGSSSIGNLTGVLGYCVKNKIIGGVGAGGAASAIGGGANATIGANSVLNGLSGRTGVTSSKDFALGQTGVLQTGNGTLPLGNATGMVRTRMCDLVLQQATKLL